MFPNLPSGVLGLDHLKFSQLSVSDEVVMRAATGGPAVEDALVSIRTGTMRAARPAMKVFFDGCQFWLASHAHRYQAARLLGACHQEFWCDIESGTRNNAVQYASRITSASHTRHGVPV
ncbi:MULTISPECIES: hypothetical protein [unclassified Caballeronia]|uniref:hypothetical protein n=1 Tax=unclassified Caballeronia TaxID=2646786 RepID=UPI001F29BFFD|nr:MULTISPECIES: hypothetical protein [unclassified Caballeronia]MCE4547497.1 hypothetical protein [Caballeronia sp. PC1]MCE4575482.1 hypothetical protein [Caballeronia sp. CLC5]